MTDQEYRADDRVDEDDDWPGQPADFNALAAMWAERDARYATLDRPLREDQIESIRAGRKREVNDLPVKDRARAFARAATWYPPEHGQGGLDHGMRSVGEGLKGYLE